MAEKSSRYIPALSFHWLTPVYDPLMKWVMHEETFKRRLIQQANIQSEQRVLDVGCGTGTLTVMVAQSHPDASITGVDGDPAVLQVARQKAAQAGAEITWDEGLAYRLPYPDRSFDRVFSSLVIHHLTLKNKRQAFREMLRVLTLGSSLHIVDFGQPHSPPMRLVVKIMRGFEETKENFAGLIPRMLIEAGFRDVVEVDYFGTIFGPVSLYHAVRPQEV